MTFDYYFPLFEELLHGSLNPLLPANAESPAYVLRMQEQVVAATRDAGIYRLQWQMPFNLKTRYYQQKLLSETFLYVEDLTDYLQGESNRAIRSYLRDQILDKHLSTCLMRLGEKLRAENLLAPASEKSGSEADADRLSNVYIFGLLKACLAKAYLEVQHLLSDVVVCKQTEEWLYASLVGELPPVNRWLRKLHTGDATAATTSQPATEERVAYYDSRQVRELGGFSESTLNRLKKTDGFPKSTRLGKKDLYTKAEIDAWLESRPFR